jgi:gentisate 1,2-dioxygenase
MTTQTLDALRADMERGSVVPPWGLEGEIMGLAPRPRTQPWLRRGNDLSDIAKRAGSLVPVERGGDRHAIALSNPGEGGMPYATSTQWAALEWLHAMTAVLSGRADLVGVPV